MTPVTVTNVDELRRLVGTPIGPSGWREVTQQAVEDFSRISGDARWIHTDSERARRESPFGGPVAHGNLTLAMIDGFREQLVDWSGFQLDINYGFNKVRFPAPVPVGSKLRRSSRCSASTQWRSAGRSCNASRWRSTVRPSRPASPRASTS